MLSYIEENKEHINWKEFAEWINYVKEDEDYDFADKIIDGLDDESYAKYETAAIEQLKNDVKKAEE